MELRVERVTRRSAVVFILLCCILNSETALAKFEIGEPFIRNHTANEYDGNSQVWAITEDHRGVMYVATTSEVLEFDGRKWRKIEISPGSGARSLAVGTDGRIYVGGSGKIGYLAPDPSGRMKFHSLTPFIPSKHRKFKAVWVTKSTSLGVYFIHKRGGFRWHREKMEVLPFGSTDAIQIGDALYIFFERSICRVSAGTHSVIPGGLLDADTYGFVRIYPSFRDHELIVASREKGLFFFSTKEAEAKGETRLRKFDNVVDPYITPNRFSRAVVIGNRALAIGTRKGGIVVVDPRGNLVQIVNEQRGLSSNTVNSLYADRFGNLWAGLLGGIAHIHLNDPLTSFGKSSGLKSSPYTVTRHQGELYVATLGHGPTKLLPYQLGTEPDGPRFQFPDGSQFRYGWDFLSLGETLLVASQAILFTSNGKMELIPETPTSYALVKSTRFPDRIFVGVSGPDGGGLGILAVQSGLGSAGTQRGKIPFKYEGKVPGVSEIIRHIEEDSKGNLWLSTRASGLVYVKFASDSPEDVEIIRYTTKHGLPNMDWNRLEIFGNDYLVLTHEGIFRANQASSKDPTSIRFVPELQLQAKPEDRSDKSIASIRGMDVYGKNRWVTNPINRYGILERKADGNYVTYARPFSIISVQMSSPFVDRDQVLWIASEQKLYRYDPSIQKDYDAPYTTLIREVRTKLGRGIFQGAHTDPASKRGDHFHKVLSQQPGTSIPTFEYVENGITFEFSASYFEHSDKNQFQFKLHGFDDKWSDWSDKSLKEYNSLIEGKYRFEVRAKNLYGSLGAPASYRFRILPPWYRTPWAYAGYVVGFLLLMYLAVRFNTRRLVASKRRLEGVVKERTAEIVEQKDQLEVAYRQVNETKDALWGEMELAKKIQTILLPEDPQIPGYEITGFMHIADEVGGDYYDVIDVNGKHWIVIGDVSGHGVSAGLVMMMVQTAIDSVVRTEAFDSTAKILESINQSIFKNIQKLGEGKYMTITLMSVEPDGTVYFSGLHQDIVIYRSATKQLEIVETQGIWIGLLDNIDGMNRVDTFRLDPGDTLLLFTDGIVESTDANEEMYGDEKLRSVFKRHGEADTLAIKEMILASMDGYHAFDDVTLLLVKKNPDET